MEKLVCRIRPTGEDGVTVVNSDSLTACGNERSRSRDGGSSNPINSRRRRHELAKGIDRDTGCRVD